MVRGLQFPILEDVESKGLTRFLTPNSNDIEAIRREIIRRRKELFDVVGMMLAKDTKSSESAEVKAWDRLDPQAVLAERAQALEEAETRAVAISKELDSTFREYKPKYLREFDISDMKEDFENLVTLSNMKLPESACQETMIAAVHQLNKLRKIDPERFEEIFEDIETFEFGAGLADLAAQFAEAGVEPEEVEEESA